MANEEITEKIVELAREHGFECIGITTANKLRVRDEVRDMCSADKCKSYDRNWACPPACGTLDYFREEIGKRSSVVVFQTVGDLEDEFDIETMMETSDLHKERIPKFVSDVREIVPDCLVLAAGACTICSECSYPDAECRFPNRSFVSMEASGLVVSDTCTAAGIPYNHGSDHIAYVSCVVI